MNKTHFAISSILHYRKELKWFLTLQVSLQALLYLMNEYLNFELISFPDQISNNRKCKSLLRDGVQCCSLITKNENRIHTFLILTLKHYN